MCIQTKENYDTYLIAGLGNPGSEYKFTRHNIGFMVIDKLAEALNITTRKVKYKAITGSGSVDNKKVILAKPKTYMNKSGESVASLVRYYKIPLENVIIIFDDLDIPFGTLKIRAAGGTSGHNGMKSITEKLGSQDFPRIRMGIGRPPGRMDPVDYVLQNFSTDQMFILNKVLDTAVSALKTFLVDGLDKAMNTYNGEKSTN